ncbi:cation diffusion facilitator family transporter [Mesorhizobium xinjiangense]|uniref:cation diffusion facilitator family transporter n=1 Tax=Mesorhizobium xinjiangense TaxID=2678685 RepID=UPI0012ED4C41|nr:cation transporter [Mesorhizobium xinjiangense]
MDTTHEQRLLRLSIAVTVVVGLAGIVSGLFTWSRAIVFDGMYSLVDAMLTTGSLAVSKLVAQEGSRRFQYGYWHLEPMVEVFGGAILALACLYAAVNAIAGLLAGGHDVAYGFGAIWAGLLCAISLLMAAYIRRHARALGSPLLALDARSWLVSGFLSLALLVGFLIAVALGQSGTAAHWVPYVDSIVLLAIALAMLPMPVRPALQAMRDVLQVAPGELDRKVHSVMDALVGELGFADYTSHVAKVGRARFIEIHILVPPDYRIGTIADADNIRNIIAQRLEAHSPQFWLTVDFTADRAWT